MCTLRNESLSVCVGTIKCEMREATDLAMHLISSLYKAQREKKHSNNGTLVVVGTAESAVCRLVGWLVRLLLNERGINKEIGVIIALEIG